MKTLLQQETELQRECCAILDDLAEGIVTDISAENMIKLRRAGRIQSTEWRKSQTELQKLVDGKRSLKRQQMRALVFDNSYQELTKDLDKAEKEVPELLAEIEPQIEALTKQKNDALRNREKLRNRKSEADVARAELRKDKYQIPTILEAYRLSWQAVNNSLGNKKRDAESQLHSATVAVENDPLVKQIGSKTLVNVSANKQLVQAFRVAEAAGCIAWISDGERKTQSINQDAWRKHVIEQKKIVKELTPVVEELRTQFDNERENCERMKDCWLTEQHPLDAK